jgi:hypothetical protein
MGCKHLVILVDDEEIVDEEINDEEVVDQEISDEEVVDEGEDLDG